MTGQPDITNEADNEYIFTKLCFNVILKKIIFMCNSNIFDQLCRYADIDGANRHTVLAEGTVPHPFSITIFEEWMYWTDWNHKSIEKANRFTGNY